MRWTISSKLIRLIKKNFLLILGFFSFISIFFISVLLWAVTPTLVFLVYGQSLANGSGSTPTSTQLGENAAPADTISSVVWPGESGSVTSVRTGVGNPGFAALTETDTEKPRSGFANEYFTLSGNSVLAIDIARGGYPFTSLTTGTQAWQWVTWAIQNVAASLVGESFLGTLFFHGEADEIIATSISTYEGYLTTLQTNIQDLVRSYFFDYVSGGRKSSDILKLFVAQENSWTKMIPSATSNGPAIAQGIVAQDNPTTHCFINPNYQRTHNADGIHLLTAGYRSAGSKAARVALGLDSCIGLVTTSVVLSGAVITATYNLGAGRCIALDTSTVSDPGNYGFAYFCGSSPPAISTVTCGCTSCTITLASTPSGACQTTDVLRYAYTGTSGNNAGPTTGARGCVRDDNPATNWAGDAMQSWSPAFTKTVN